MNTSYFASPKIKQTDPRLVSVSRQQPVWFYSSIKIYKPLCPSWELVMSYKEGKITEKQYTERYYSEVLDKLDPVKTYQELGEDAILLCYEKPKKFCHRRVIAYWFLEHLNIEVNEL